MVFDATVQFEGARARMRQDGEIALVELFNPHNGCFDAVSESELSAVLDLLDGTGGLRVLVLTGGAPGVFVRHYDLQTLHHIAAKLHGKGLRFAADRPVPEAAFPGVVRRVTEARYATIAAINGVAMGGGLELALACDIRLAQAGAYPIGLPELGIGILPGAGGTLHMTQLLGPGRTLYNLLTGRMYTPLQALEAGLVDECVAEVQARALEVARHVAALPARACAYARRLVREVGNVPHATAMAQERTLMCDCLVDPESMERVRAVLDKGLAIESLSLAMPD